MMKKVSAQKTTLAALAIAIVCISTAVIQIPIPLGYMHFGNICILLCSFLFPWDIGLLAGGIGSAMSDLFTGYPQWILPTLLIKGLMGFTASYLMHSGKHTASIRNARTLVASILAILIMIAGYTMAGTILYGSIFTGLAQIPGLALEGIIGIIGFYAIGYALEKCHIQRLLSEGVH